MPPTQIDRYQILDLLGKGGMGQVFRAYDPDLGREVALKLVTLLKSFQQALIIIQEIGDRSGEGSTFNNIGGWCTTNKAAMTRR